MKRFNLLEDTWIPVKTTDGESIQIKACEIVRNDIKALDAPRADLNAALIQFLVGLVQTALMPENIRDWQRLYAQPPLMDELKKKFESIIPAFFLDGDGPRFMQDESIRETGNKAGILKLLPSLVGENTIKKNQDFFLKSTQVVRLSISNLISALYLYQNYCLYESGGRNGSHYGSLRGRNSVATLIFKESGSLWENIWLNTLPKDRFLSLLNTEVIIDDNNFSANDFEWMNLLPQNSVGFQHGYWAKRHK